MNFGKEFKQYATKHAGINSMHVDQYVDASMTPYIIEERQLNMSQMDVFSRLMMDRIIFLGTGINDQSSKHYSSATFVLRICRC